MKPLASPSIPSSADSNGEIVINGKDLHLVGILNPDEITDRCTGLVCIVASKDLSGGMDGLANGEGQAYLSQLRFSPEQRRELQSLLCLSMRNRGSMTRAHNCVYIGKYFVYGWNGKPLKMKFAGTENFLQTNDRNLEFLRSQKWKFLVDELDDCSTIMLPVDSKTNVMIEVNSNAGLEGNVTSGPPTITRRNITNTITTAAAGANNFRLPIKLFMSTPPRVQWKSFLGFAAILQENLLKKTNGSSRKNVGFLKWVTGRRNKASSEDYYAEEVDGRANLKGEENKLLGKEGRKNYWKKNGQKKVKRINLGERRGGGGNVKRGQQEEVLEDKQLIRIELKPDPLIQESSFQFCSGDLLRLKLTMFEFPMDNGYELDIDFVQNFMCKTDTLNSCRCRRISKLLHRAIITDFNWEKGIHISGQQFSMCWIPFRIPSLDQYENENDPFALGTPLDKFKVASFQYELQIRLYRDDELSHYILSASSFPLNIEINSTSDEENCSEHVGDILQIFEEEVTKPEVQQVDWMIKKSMSACEFDV